MKQQKFLPFFTKVALLSLFFVGMYQGYWYFFQQKDISKNTQTQEENATRFQSAYAANYGNVGVALSTRIGMQFTSQNSALQSGWFYREIASVGINSDERKIQRADMISQNMLIIQEYLNLSKTDIKTLLNTSADRKNTLEGFISQLELRYKNSAISVQSLEKQKTLLVAKIEKNQANIAAIKASMEKNFGLAQAAETLKDVERYYVLRAEYTEMFTDIVFINQFLKQHNFLNNYNKVILDTLINNKEAIINQNYVVIPDSGNQYLRPLELIFDEADIKAKLSGN